MKAALSFVLLSATSAFGQTAVASTSYVTEIITDYGAGGYWRSGTGSPNAAASTTRPDNSHALLAFVVDNGSTLVNGKKYFSTGVNNATLTTNGISYNSAVFQSLGVGTYSGTVGSNTKVSLGQLYDGVDNGPSNPPPASGYGQYLTDGTQGLNLGTGVANLPVGTLSFGVNNLQAAAIGDGIPDLIITQIASPSSNVDSYRFLDGSGALVSGTRVLTANFTSVPSVGKWVSDFYEASVNPMTLSSGFTKTERDLRLLAFDLSLFGLNSSNIASVQQFQISLGGDSDQAFIAYNTSVVTPAPLPVQLTSFVGQSQGTGVRLRWTTASELNSAYFDVEASADGQTYAAVGRVAAAGTSQYARSYQFDHQPAQAGQQYYRLRQADLDGTARYSPTVVVRTGAAAVDVFPTVVTDQLTVRLPAAGAATLGLLAADGRLLRQQVLPARSAAAEMVLSDLATLPAGLYLLRVVLDGQAVQQRVVKQ